MKKIDVRNRNHQTTNYVPQKKSMIAPKEKHRYKDQTGEVFVITTDGRQFKALDFDRNFKTTRTAIQKKNYKGANPAQKW